MLKIDKKNKDNYKKVYKDDNNDSEYTLEF